jgi:MinD superfamily P-loop ATPase
MKVVIASGKGGTGKTSLSVNLAHHLSKSQPTILIDLDVEEPNSGLFINHNNGKTTQVYKQIPVWKEDLCTQCGFCESACNFNAIISLGKDIIVSNELCHSCHVCSDLCPEDALPMQAFETGTIKQSHHDNLNFIEGRLNVGEEQATPLIKETKDYTAKQNTNQSINIFDAPPGTSCSMVEATKDADYVILITEPTPFGFNDVKLAIETVKTLKRPFGIVINKYGIGNSDLEDYCQKEGINIIGKINNDRAIAEQYAKGELWHNIKHAEEALESIKQSIIKLRV